MLTKITQRAITTQQTVDHSKLLNLNIIYPSCRGTRCKNLQPSGTRAVSKPVPSHMQSIYNAESRLRAKAVKSSKLQVSTAGRSIAQTKDRV